MTVSDDPERLRDCMKDRATVRQIAAELACAPKTVRADLQREGIPVPSMLRTPMTSTPFSPDTVPGARRHDARELGVSAR